MVPRNTIGVYLIRNTITGAVYVGSSRRCVRERWQKHISELQHQKHPNERLQRAWDKYGQASFEFILHEEMSRKEDVLGQEQYWMDWFRAQASTDCYNLTSKAHSRAPYQITDEMRKRLSDSHKGYVWSEESRRKLSIANSGRIPSEETRRRLSESHKGYKPSPESMQKRADANRGKGRPKITYEGLISPDGQEYRDILHLGKFARERGLDYGHLHKVATGAALSHRGWRRIGTAPKRTYCFISPEGVRHEGIPSLEAFCREHKLGDDCMRLVHEGKQPRHRGWTKG